jgi:hypothetical protein
VPWQEDNSEVWLIASTELELRKQKVKGTPKQSDFLVFIFEAQGLSGPPISASYVAGTTGMYHCVGLKNRAALNRQKRLSPTASSARI